jgi:hypothetical protein
LLWSRNLPAGNCGDRARRDDEVTEALRTLRENRLRVVVRGGGHQWSASPCAMGAGHRPVALKDIYRRRG